MPFYKRKKSETIVSGYVRQIIKNVVISDVINIIKIFYNDYIVFNVHGSSTKKFIKNCIYFCFVGDSRFYIRNDYSLNVGQLRLKGNSNLKHDINSIRHDYFNGNNIQYIRNTSINGYHCFIYTKQCDLYGFTYDMVKDISNSKIRSYLRPHFLTFNFDSTLTQISYGFQHTLFLTQNGNVYGSGENSCGQLLTMKNIDPASDILNNIYGNISNILNNSNIVDIGCCLTSSYVLDSNNVLYSFGDNTHGQLGIQNSNIKNINWISRALNGTKIKTFSCGRIHIGILTDNNMLWMFGSNGEYQCGHKTFRTTSHDGNEIILNDELITDIKCGLSHNIIKTNKNNYYGFGCNKFNQLLIKKYKYDFIVIKPKLISKQWISKLINCHNDIIDLIPANNETFIIY